MLDQLEVASEGADSPVPQERASLWARAAFVLRVLQVRLRFVLVLMAIFAVLASWNYLTRLVDWTITRLTGTGERPEHVSPDTEYFCPMCPGVLSNWPEKCPVCKMPLVRRRKGDAALLPEGVLARMQLSPQRLQLAGVQTSKVQYQSLNREWQSPATVEILPGRLTPITAPADGAIVDVQQHLLWQKVSQDQMLASLELPLPNDTDDAANRTQLRAPHSGTLIRLLVQPHVTVKAGELIAEVADLSSLRVVTRVSHEDAPLVREGQTVDILSNTEQVGNPHRGVVVAIQPVADHPLAGTDVRIEIAQPDESLRPGSLVHVAWRVPLADIEPFRSLPRNPGPLTQNELRDVHFCPDHPAYLHTKTGECPFDDQPLQSRILAANQRLEWHCPAHLNHRSTQAANCADCNGLPLVATVVSYCPTGQVLSIPDSAVIDTGAKHIVFVEMGPGMFDAVAVQAGPRSGSMRSVTSGLEAGQRVVSSGAFLLDAETRLTANLSAAYFGAGARGNGGADTEIIEATDSRATASLETFGLAANDAARARAQKVCPATGFPLGSMGAPVKVRAGEHVVYLCCSACKRKITGATEVGANADTLAPESKASGK